MEDFCYVVTRNRQLPRDTRRAQAKHFGGAAEVDPRRRTRRRTMHLVRRARVQGSGQNSGRLRCVQAPPELPAPQWLGAPGARRRGDTVRADTGIVALRDRQTAAEASREEARRHSHATARTQIEERRTRMGMDYPSNKTGFVYTNYIKATPDRVWHGLTDPILTKRYWRHPAAGGKTFPSDWKKGSTWDLVHEDAGLVVTDPEQVILESDPYRRLAYTWHTFTP